MKQKKNRSEYWKDWYWNKGGREKVQARRYIREYERLKKNLLKVARNSFTGKVQQERSEMVVQSGSNPD